MTGQAPDFIGIGAQRSGTSWMAVCFWAHPDVYMPGKELQFFNKKGEIQLDDYFSKFDSPERKQGEFTPDYLSDKRAIDRIAEHCPKAKLIVILREPVSRTLSSFKLYRERGEISPDTTLEALFESKHDIYQKSLYGKQLDYLFSKIDKEQVLVCFYDEVVNNPIRLIQRVYRFIGADATFVPESINRNFNASSVAFENPSLNTLLTNVQNYLSSRLWGRKLLAFKKTETFRQFKQGLINKKKAKTEQASKANDYSHYFKQDLELLQSLIQQKLPENWIK
jgi:hypothetical protein